LPRNAGMPKTHPPRRGKSNFSSTVLGGLAALSLLILSLLVSYRQMNAQQSQRSREAAFYWMHHSDLSKESYRNRTHSIWPGRNSSELKPAAEEIKPLPKLQPAPQQPHSPPPPRPPPPFSQFPITLEDLASLQGTWEASERSKPRCLSFSVGGDAIHSDKIKNPIVIRFCVSAQGGCGSYCNV
jgi:hypothetical protein